MDSKIETNNISTFNNLFDTVTSIDKVFSDNTAKAINRNLTARNWLIGYYIVNYEQNGSDRAKYGAKTLQKLAEKLNSRSLLPQPKTISSVFLGVPDISQTNL